MDEQMLPSIEACDKAIVMCGDDATMVSLKTLAEGTKEILVKVQAQAKAQGDIVKAIGSRLDKLLPPDVDMGIYNVHAKRSEVDVPDGEPEEILIDGEPEMRTPSHKEYQWIVEVNHSVSVNRGASGKGGNGVGARAIQVFKRDGTQLEDKGCYPSASKACEALGLLVGGDSAPRVLTREGYIAEHMKTS